MTTPQPPTTTPPSAPPSNRARGRRALTVFAWLWVGLPLGYGVYELVHKVTQLFRG
ncbi:MFS transporter small subunit [Streptomyces venezuelae]|uniref:MFS transporter small subunit n=1 Tax=Streptomyces venezuelae TaxID=54571 RepID=UPI003F56388C